jgi:hypothetical protein
MPDVFISYFSEDRARALALASELAKRGVTSFVDCLSLYPGDQLGETIEQNIERSVAMLTLWSRPPTPNRPWVARELESARRHDLRCIPVWLGDLPSEEDPDLLGIQLSGSWSDPEMVPDWLIDEVVRVVRPGVLVVPGYSSSGREVVDALAAATLWRDCKVHCVDPSRAVDWVRQLVGRQPWRRVACFLAPLEPTDDVERCLAMIHDIRALESRFKVVFFLVDRASPTDVQFRKEFTSYFRTTLPMSVEQMRINWDRLMSEWENKPKSSADPLRPLPRGV